MPAQLVPAADLHDLAGRGFTELVEVGRGSHAVVYRARQATLARDVAVKVLDLPGAAAAVTARWRQECLALGAVSAHPAIVALLDVGTTASGRPYLVLEHAPGGALSAHLARRGPLPPAAALHIGVDLAGALEAAHRAGVLHLDVKPDNVLVSAYGQVQLADFGVARLQRDADGGRSATGGSARGSLAHAAPEVLAGAAPTAAADVYGLASTLCSLLGGAASATVAGRGVPAPLAAVLAAALSADPRQRPASAAAFGRRLQQVQAALRLPVTPLVVSVDVAPDDPDPDPGAPADARADGDARARADADAHAVTAATRTFGPGPPLLPPARAPRTPPAVLLALGGGAVALLLAVAHLVAA